MHPIAGTPAAVRIALLCTLVAACAGSLEEPFDVVEATVPEMQLAMEEGRITSRELVEAHRVHVAPYEEEVNAIIAVNENAYARELPRAAPSLRHELHRGDVQRAARLELAYAFEQAPQRRVAPPGMA